MTWTMTDQPEAAKYTRREGQFQEEGAECLRHGFGHVHRIFYCLGGAVSHIQNVGAVAGLDLVYPNCKILFKEKNAK